jgi:hypothetical protein
MARRILINADHPLRKLFRKALDFGFRENPADKPASGLTSKNRSFASSSTLTISVK